MARTTPLLKDDQWLKLDPLLPSMPPGKKGGRPWRNNRQVLEGILWVLKTGARWRDLPERYPSPSTCWRRLKLWEEMDIWLDIWRALLAQLDEQQYLMWEETFADGSFAPAKKGGPASARPRRAKEQSGWWWSTARVFPGRHTCFGLAVGSQTDRSHAGSGEGAAWRPRPAPQAHAQADRRQGLRQ